jgi:hypothetical protein
MGHLLGEGSYKAPKGLIKVQVQVCNNTIDEIHISGDFFMYPEDRLWELEQTLTGIPAKRENILSTIKDFYIRVNLLTPGVIPADFTEAIIRGINSIT